MGQGSCGQGQDMGNTSGHTQVTGGVPQISVLLGYTRACSSSFEVTSLPVERVTRSHSSSAEFLI